MSKMFLKGIDNKTYVMEAPLSPIKGIDYWTEADQESIVQQVITALGTPVFGRVDKFNNIILTGELTSGLYTVKYEDAEGNVTEIGVLNQEGGLEPTYTNQLPISTDADGNVYNGTGYNIGYRLNSSSQPVQLGTAGASNPTFVTGFIPAKTGQTIYLKNCYFDVDGINGYQASDETKAYYGHDCSGLNILLCNSIKSTKNAVPWANTSTSNYVTVTPDANGICTQITINQTDVHYVRLTLAGDAANAIITVNEPITDGPVSTSYTNQIPISTDTSGDIYNNTGYGTMSRINSSGQPVVLANTSASNPTFVTGFIPVQTGQTLRFKDCYIDADGIDGTNTDNTKNYYGEAMGSLQVALYDENKNKIGGSSWYEITNPTAFSVIKNSDGTVRTLRIMAAGVSFIRLTLAGTPSKAVVTVNENIPEIENNNLVFQSINTDGSQFVGDNGEDGYRTGYRLNSTGTTAVQPGFAYTGYMPVNKGDTIGIIGMIFTINYGTQASQYIHFYDENFVFLSSVRGNEISSASGSNKKEGVLENAQFKYGYYPYADKSINYLTGFTITQEGAKYMRVCSEDFSDAIDIRVVR